MGDRKQRLAVGLFVVWGTMGLVLGLGTLRCGGEHGVQAEATPIVAGFVYCAADGGPEQVRVTDRAYGYRRTVFFRFLDPETGAVDPSYRSTHADPNDFREHYRRCEPQRPAVLRGAL